MSGTDRTFCIKLEIFLTPMVNPHVLDGFLEALLMNVNSSPGAHPPSFSFRRESSFQRAAKLARAESSPQFRLQLTPSDPSWVKFNCAEVLRITISNSVSRGFSGTTLLFLLTPSSASTLFSL